MSRAEQTMSAPAATQRIDQVRPGPIGRMTLTEEINQPSHKTRLRDAHKHTISRKGDAPPSLKILFTPP